MCSETNCTYFIILRQIFGSIYTPLISPWAKTHAAVKGLMQDHMFILQSSWQPCQTVSLSDICPTWAQTGDSAVWWILIWRHWRLLASSQSVQLGRCVWTHRCLVYRCVGSIVYQVTYKQYMDNSTSSASLTYLDTKFDNAVAAAAVLRIQVISDVLLCAWVRGFWHFTDHGASSAKVKAVWEQP